MKAKHFSLLIGIAAFLSCQKEQASPILNNSQAAQSADAVQSNPATIPITAVSFPKEVIPVAAGKIDFWAKLYGYSGYIPTSGDPVFYYITDGFAGYSISFASNDGLGDGGLIGGAGTAEAGTGAYGSWTYARALNNAPADKWHHYIIIWNKNGLTCFNDGRKIAVYVDGKLNSKSWHVNPYGDKFPELTGGTLNLIHTSAAFNAAKEVAIDEFKVYDKQDKLILWNTLGSKEEVENSAVGLNGSFNGFGNARFIPGKVGNALIASPINGIGNP